VGRHEPLGANRKERVQRGSDRTSPSYGVEGELRTGGQRPVNIYGLEIGIDRGMKVISSSVW